MAKYQMRQKMFAIGDDFWIEDDGGQKAFKVDGKALRLRKTFQLESPSGEQLYRIQKRMLRVRDSMAVENAQGDTIAKIHKAMISPFRDRWIVDLGNGESWKVKGKILDHEYKVEAEDGKVAEISKKWFRVRDTYGVDIESARNPALVLAVVVAVDAMSHPTK